jgi:hypothetical protein
MFENYPKFIIKIAYNVARPSMIKNDNVRKFSNIYKLKIVFILAYFQRRNRMQCLKIIQNL